MIWLTEGGKVGKVRKVRKVGKAFSCLLFPDSYLGLAGRRMMDSE